MNIKKAGIITICGRPNVGKSTLTNKLAGEKIAIVSDKPQTTRNRITAVVNRGESQFVFLDTPGVHKPRTKLGDFMVKTATDTLSGVDAAVLVVCSVSGVQPATYRPGSAGSVSISHDGQIALWRARGNQYAGSSMCDGAFMQLMLEIKYANLGSNAIMKGCQAYSTSYAAAVSESGVNRIEREYDERGNLLWEKKYDLSMKQIN